MESPGVEPPAQLKPLKGTGLLPSTSPLAVLRQPKPVALQPLLLLKSQRPRPGAAIWSHQSHIPPCAISFLPPPSSSRTSTNPKPLQLPAASSANAPSLVDDLAPNPNEPRQRKVAERSSPPSRLFLAASCRAGLPNFCQQFFQHLAPVARHPASRASPRLASPAPSDPGPALSDTQTAIPTAHPTSYLDTRTRSENELQPASGPPD
ncbi:hypothetical protein J3F83DRAFT_352733 [Trichoderma novae-zelandiae]